MDGRCGRIYFTLSLISAMADNRTDVRNPVCLVGKLRLKNKVCMFYFIWFVLIYPVLASKEKTALIEVSKLEITLQKRLTAGGQRSGTDHTNDIEYRFLGKLLEIGREDNVEGRLHLVFHILMRFKLKKFR